MKKNAVNWFEIYVENFDRAKKFYETVMNCKLRIEDFQNMKIGIFPFEEKAGIGGSITCGNGMKASSNGTIVYLNAENDLDGIVSRVEKAGGKVIMPRLSIEPNGFIALFSDPEGNTVGLHSYN